MLEEHSDTKDEKTTSAPLTTTASSTNELAPLNLEAEGHLTTPQTPNQEDATNQEIARLLASDQAEKLLKAADLFEQLSNEAAANQQNNNREDAGETEATITDPTIPSETPTPERESDHAIPPQFITALDHSQEDASAEEIQRLLDEVQTQGPLAAAASAQQLIAAAGQQTHNDANTSNLTEEPDEEETSDSEQSDTASAHEEHLDNPRITESMSALGLLPASDSATAPDQAQPATNQYLLDLGQAYTNPNTYIFLAIGAVIGAVVDHFLHQDNCG